MRKASPSTPPASTSSAAGRSATEASGRTTPEQSGGEVPRLPHERDESADSQHHDRAAAQSATPTKEAFQDADQRRPDTGTGPVMNQVYARQKRPKTLPH